MNRDTADARPAYFWPLITFVIGLLVGWLAIGWGIWPVTWTNALPQDMRAAERDQYLTMVAESYAVNSDLDLAKTRLTGWSSEELAKHLANLQGNLEVTDARLAGDVQLLGQALGLGGALAPAAPTADVRPQPSASTTGTRTLLQSICTVGLWVLLGLGGIALLVYLWSRWRKSVQRGSSEPAIGESLRSVLGGRPAQRSADEIAQDVKRRWPEASVTPGEARETPPAAPTRQAIAQAELYEDVDALAEEPPPSFGAEPVRRVASWTETPSSVPVAEPSRRVAVPEPGGRLAKIGDYVAIYQMGEPDYDEGFDINDPVDGYMGQCGLQLVDPIGRNRDQAAALQVWLWDSRDTDTYTLVLMSDGAYRDTALRSAQAGEHEVMAVRPGQEFELASHDLLLKGRVERIEYADQEPVRTLFSEVQVRLQMYRKL